jgi:phosphoenolpyruvate carboxykinase (GTP)
VDTETWREEARLIPPAYERFGERLPTALWDQYRSLLDRLDAAEVDEDIAQDDLASISA